MSKTTIFLIILLLFAIGGFWYVKYEIPDNPLFIPSERPTTTEPTKPNTTLSFSPSQTTLQPGQTMTVAVLVNSSGLQPTLAQLEIAYDPTVLTALSILPGTYFTKPNIILENLNTETGRISYALKCPMLQPTNKIMACANPGANALATLTFLVNPTAQKTKTTIMFLPKTLIRSSNGADILNTVTNLTLNLVGITLPQASVSGMLIH